MRSFRGWLVPRPMALVGVIGGPLQALSGVAVLFGLYAQASPVSGLATLAEVVWEVFLAVYLTVWGFRRPAMVGESAPDGALHAA